LPQRSLLTTGHL